MAFPPEFSSTETYANKYDLDEIDVFLEGDSNNPMFFDVTGISQILTFGKHYFTISILNSINQHYKLRGGSRVLFEFKSINNVVLRSDIQKVNQKNGLIIGYVDVLKDPLRTYKEIQDGQGTFIIAASLENKENIPEENLIPEKFLNAINYRCVFPIQIRKNAASSASPIITNVSHKTQTLTGQFSFANNAVASFSRDPNNGAEYNTAGSKTTNQSNSSRKTL